ncbi:MAG: hypothetical protein GX111_00075 [Clostridiales bacterium]|jgi:hypothetical protein|nr:hypothetical protein [Clostridiales bacterium]
MKFSIRHIRGHVEVFDAKGRFLLSADNETEADRELRKMNEWTKADAEVPNAVYAYFS